MPLLFAAPGQEVTVVSVGGAQDVRQHLNELGFTAGSKITVIQKVNTGLIVKVKEARIAIDQSMASKIHI